MLRLYQLLMQNSIILLNNRILENENNSDRNEDTFIFTLNGMEIKGGTENDNGWVYCICVKLTELMKRVILHLILSLIKRSLLLKKLFAS